MIEDCSATGLVYGLLGVGGLFGYSRGSIRNSHAASTVTGTSFVGGLTAGGEADIFDSCATGSVSGQRKVGGLVGEAGGAIFDSCATGSVYGGEIVGGLVGSGGSNINNSSATGSVSGGNRVGGLVGEAYGAIFDSCATGSVSGDYSVGGLVGYSRSGVFDSCATGSVSGKGLVGGLMGILVGAQQGASSISVSYATGSVVGYTNVGGLVGDSRGDISDSYATGSVSGRGGDNVGGLVGDGRGDISDSYATGLVSGAENAGGLVGHQGNESDISNSYYAARGLNNGLGEERSFAQLRCTTTPGDACPLGSQESTYEGWGTSVWDFGSAADLPQLSSNRNLDLNRKPYIRSSTELVVRIDFMDVVGASFPLEADYPGLSGEPGTLTWSLSGVPPLLHHLVYFDLGDGTTSTTFVDREKFIRGASTVTLVVVGNEGLAGKSIYVVLKNSIFDNVDRLPVRVVGLIPSVDGGRKQTGTIWDGSTRSTLTFSATDRDSPDSGGAGLSWNILSTDIAGGLTVVFSSSQTGGTVEVEVRRDTLGSVGSFVLEVTSPAGVKTTFTVTIETVCSTEPGEDLMAGQTGTGTLRDPYQIERLCQLQDVSSSLGAHYELAADIDASKTEDWNGGAGFVPIASGEEDEIFGFFHEREQLRKSVR